MRPNGTARHQLTHTTRVLRVRRRLVTGRAPDCIHSAGDDQRTQWHVAVMPARASRGFVVVSKYSLSPDWSPDGRTLAFYACSSFCGMFTSPPWGRPLTPMPDQGLSDVMPEYRPLRSTSSPCLPRAATVQGHQSGAHSGRADRTGRATHLGGSWSP